MLNVTNLKVERVRSSFTQEELAEKVGLTRTAIHRYESGLSQPPIKVLVKLAEVLNVTTDYLLGR